MGVPAYSADLPEVRRLEAVSFRCWPSTTTIFDGTWAIRLSAGHPAKRLNSVNPLDRADHKDLEARISRAAKRFSGFGRPLVFRQSPLAPPELDNILDARGWRRFDETQVMTVPLQKAQLDHVVSLLPLKDSGRWIQQCIAMGGFDESLRPGMAELIGLAHGPVGLFLLENESGAPLAACMAVRFGGLVGIFEVVSHPDVRRQGYGRRIVESAMRWGLDHGAQQAWLQVVSANSFAVSLYERLGFVEAYRYAYRQAPDGFVG
ncbi:MAG: GNAT family N-acetyltransferase [Pseudomonadota bacterium]